LGIRWPVVVLEGPLLREHLDLARRHDLQLAVHDAHQLGLLQNDLSPEKLDCWLKIDTGMHRLGFTPEELPARLRELRGLAQVDVVGAMTHLANADDTADPATPHQLERMAAATAGLSLQRSIANSAGILAWPDAHADWVRPGLMLYGASPLLGVSAADLGLRPVMTLSAPLIAVKHVPAGAPVGYGGTWRAPEAMPLGVVGVGYGDGYPRHIRAGTQVSVRGQRAAVVGRVSMDMITIDLRGMLDVRIGERVVLWGDGMPVDELAAACDTIPYTLLCGVTARVQRRYRE
jgi:alanine racemase